MSDVEGLVFDSVALDALLHSPTGPVAADLLRRALQVEAMAKQISHAHGRGRVYGKHQASAPGDPFASDTGSLSASITHDLSIDSIGLLARVGSDQERMAWLELGTSRMAPRPTLRPSLKAATL